MDAETRSLRILLVTPMPPQPQASGAIPVVLHAQLEGLRQNHTLTLVTVAGQEPGEREAVARLREQGIEVHAVVREPLSGLKRWKRRWRMAAAWLTRRLPWRSVWFWEPEIQKILDRLLSGRDFDLVIVEDNSMGIYDYNTNLPLLFTEHEVRRPRPLARRRPERRSLAGWIFEELDWRRWTVYQRRTWQKFDRIQVFSSRDARAVAEIAPALGRPVSLNPFGIERPEQAQPEQEQDGCLLFVGNYTHAPNVDAALWLGREIMPHLLELNPRAHLDLVGIYPPPELKALHSPSIEVTGHVPDLGPYLERAAVVLAPVRIGGGMRMKVLQSLAVGKAVITTPRGAEGLDVWGVQPPLRIANDAKEFALAAAGLLDDRQARRELGRQARLFVEEHFSPQAYARRVEQAYREMTDAAEQQKGGWK